MTQSVLYSTGTVDIIRPNPNNPSHTEKHNASITITIDTDTNTVEIIMTREELNIVWAGFGFEHLPYNSTNYHKDTYAIILEYDQYNRALISEYTLGRMTEGTKYTNSEITVESDQDGILRTAIITRPITGTFSFPAANIIENYQMTVMAAIHSRTPRYPDSLRHQGNEDDRNTTTVTFQLYEPPCQILQAFVQDTEFDFKLTINCPANRIEIDIKYLNYNNNWFGIVFNDIMFGTALVYTIGKESDQINNINNYPRNEGLYSYDITDKSVELILYTPQKDWTEKFHDIENGIHIIYQHSLSETPWDGSTTNIQFRYAYNGNNRNADLTLTQHTVFSDILTFNLQTPIPTTEPTLSPTTPIPTPLPTAKPTLTPTTIAPIPTTPNPTPLGPTSAAPSHAPSLYPTLAPIKCPNGPVLEGITDADHLTVRLVLNCTSEMVTLGIQFKNYAGNQWFGLVFNDRMYGDSVVWTMGKNNEFFLTLHSYDLTGTNDRNIQYNENKQWSKILDDFSEGITIVYETSLWNTPWNTTTTNIIFMYAIGQTLRLDEHEYTSPNVYDLQLIPTGPTFEPTKAPVIDWCPYGDLIGSINTNDLQIRMEILCHNIEFAHVKLEVTYPYWNDNWFGLIFNDEMSGYSVVYTKGKENDRQMLLYTYNISKPRTIDNVIYTSEYNWNEIFLSFNHGLHIEYNNTLDNTPINGRMKSLTFRYVIGSDIQLDKHINVSKILSIHFEPQIINGSDIRICNDTYTCAHKTLNCIANGGECKLACTTQDSCENMKYYCSDKSIECNVFCLDIGACKGAEITCNKDNNCNIISENSNSLENAIINGATNSILSVNCSKSGEGCINATIKGYKSSKVIIDCRSIRSGMRGCENINIYCPQRNSNDEYIKNCEIIGDGPGSNNLPMTTHETLSIYAINSWYDIDLSTYIGNVEILGSKSKMYCGENYEYNCDINNPKNIFEWNCINNSSKCYREIDNYYTIQCNGNETGNCYDTIIDCTNHDFIHYYDGCKIKCNGKNSCQNSYIKCMENKPCIIECNGDYSCSNNINLNNNNNSPNNHSIQCPNNNNCHILCNGINSCEYSSILCPNNTKYNISNNTNYECNIYANGIESFKNGYMNGLYNNNITINCVESSACKKGIFSGVNSNLLTINCLYQQDSDGQEDKGSCQDINVQCPSYNMSSPNKNKNCFVIGGGENDIHYNLSFYCINSWNDIHLDLVGYLKYNSNIVSNKMYCTNDYSESCTMTSLQSNKFCQCPNDQSDTALNWVIIISVGIGALFIVLITTIIICSLVEKEKKKYTKLNNGNNNNNNQHNDNGKINGDTNVPSPDGSDPLH